MRRARLNSTPRQAWNRRAGANLHSREVRGRHTVNAGFVPGDAWAECQRCGFDVLSSQLREDGYREGLLVCPKCYDPPHPQDYVQAFEDTLVPDSPSPGGLDTIDVVAGTDIDGNATRWTEVNDDPTGSTEVPGPVGTTIETL